VFKSLILLELGEGGRDRTEEYSGLWKKGGRGRWEVLSPWIDQAPLFRICIPRGGRVFRTSQIWGGEEGLGTNEKGEGGGKIKIRGVAFVGGGGD